VAFKKIEAKITGIVQGVGFRFYVERMANLLGITGWVKNMYDGSVKVVGIGTETKIDEFLITLRKGPSLARVDNVEYKIEDVDYNEYDTFEIY